MAAAAVEEDGDATLIAAFAVAKGGVVIKHIFLNEPPPEVTKLGEEDDPPVLVGRHPDCHVLVDHPSVSRFHLQLTARHRQRRITVTDLSSVHGTWVSGRRIPPNTPVDLTAGDTLRLGASRREYRLLWLTLREAFEVEGPLPPLLEEDREEARPCEDTSQKIVSENIAFPAVIPSAAPLPEVSRSVYQEECTLSQFHDRSEEVTKEKSVDKSQISDPLGSLIKQDMPAAVTNAGRPAQLAKHDASSQVSKRAKLKSVIPLRVDTGRNRDGRSTLSYSFQKEDEKDIIMCSQNCGAECAACIALFGISEFEGTYQKKEMIAEEKGHMKLPASITTMQGNKDELTNPENYVPHDSAHEKSEKSLGLLHDVDFSELISENTSVPEVKFTGLSTSNLKGSISNNENVAPNKIAEDPEDRQPEGTICENLFDNLDTKGFEYDEEISPPNKENITPCASGNIMMERINRGLKPTTSQELIDSISPLHLVKLNGLSTPNMEGSISNNENMAPNKIAEDPEDRQPEGTICENLFDNSDTKGFEYNEEISPLDKENITPCASGNIMMERINRGLKPTTSQELIDSISPLHLVKLNGLSTPNMEGSISNNENMAPNKIAEDPEDRQPEGTICENLFDNSDTKGFEYNEEISPLDKENITPCASGTERINRGLKPTTSQELIDSISPLHLVHDIFLEKENSMLNIGNDTKSNEPTSANLIPLISADTKLQQNQTNFMPISHLEFKDDILSDRENSLLATGNDAISPVRQENLFSDKENVTPTSRDRKPIARRFLGSRMDDSVSAENTSNTRIHKWEHSELSAKPKKFHAVDDDVFYSDKENLTPISSGGTKSRKYLAKNFTVDADQDQEAFFSDKENSTPLSSAAQKTRDMSENHARIESAITKKRIVDRLPFQTLLSNSPLRPTSSPCRNCAAGRAAAGDLGIRLDDELDNLSRNRQESGRTGQGMKAWAMVADTDTLLDDGSRKSIMLLKGIKGTHLIIPRIVIRELDSMKQREGLFRRSSKATSILQWIDECMENESWWIHVQSSSEMLPVAPTPPATPSAQCMDEEIKFSSGSFNPMALFSPRSFVDIISPRPEDGVLDCALLFNKLRSEQNTVVLSNSITLKIKAMAEGLLCEGAKEFRESLMNPCSDRFMWAANVPRGSAWSCLDEAALAENYYNSHHQERKRVPRPVEAAKGLKLILRHNSIFAQATSPARKAPLASLASV